MNSPSRSTRNAGRRIPLDKHDLEKYGVFTFGVIFLIAILVIVLGNPTPTLAQFFVFRLVLALAAAGIGALLPGFIHFEQNLPYRGLIRCGGALALFAAVWFSNPAKLAIEDIAPPPVEDATPILNGFIALTDQNDDAAAYSMFAEREKGSVPFPVYQQLVGNVRRPLGKRTSGPVLWNASQSDEVPGRKGPFVFRAYQSTFSGKPGVWVEIAGVIAEEGKWKMFTYTLNPCLEPYCKPLHHFEAKPSQARY